MKRQYILWYTAALVAAVIGAVAFGVPDPPRKGP